MSIPVEANIDNLRDLPLNFIQNLQAFLYHFIGEVLPYTSSLTS